MGDNCRASPIGAQGGSPPAAPRGQRQGWTSRGRTSRQAPSAKCAAETEGFGGKVAEGNGEAAHKRPRRDVERREEKPRRERRRVCSRSLGGRRGTNANRNNATVGQTPGRQRRRISPSLKASPKGRLRGVSVRLIYLQPANYGKLLRSPRPVVVSFSSFDALAGRPSSLATQPATTPNHWEGPPRQRAEKLKLSPPAAPTWPKSAPPS